MSDPDTHPRTWKEMSLDFRLFFVFHGCMMVLMVVGRLLPIEVLAGLVVALAAALATVSVRHRRAVGWRWPGVGAKGLLGAVLSVAAGTLFLGAVGTQFSPLRPQVFPWFAAGAAIVACWILLSLGVVVRSEAAFRSHCGDDASARRE